MVVSSTNNKAVDNVIDKLDESLKNEFFYLKGGNREKINSPGGARYKLQQALNSSFHSDYHEQHKKLFELSRQFLNQEAFRDKQNVTRAVKLYSDFLSGNYKAKQRISENLDEYLKALSLIFPVVTSTLLSVRNMLPSPEECVDRVIIDEAGMIPLHQTFP